VRTSASAILVAALATAVAAPPAASARTYDVTRAVARVLPSVAAGTDVPVRLPARLALDYDGTVSADASTSRARYAIHLGAVPGCGTASACNLATFSGRRGGRLPMAARVTLARGIEAAYTPSRCGASCSPASIRWLQRGVLYAITAKVPGSPRATLVRAANSSAGRRAR
jgi:hypothetical protein